MYIDHFSNLKYYNREPSHTWLTLDVCLLYMSIPQSWPLCHQFFFYHHLLFTFRQAPSSVWNKYFLFDVYYIQNHGLWWAQMLCPCIKMQPWVFREKDHIWNKLDFLVGTLRIQSSSGMGSPFCTRIVAIIPSGISYPKAGSVGYEKIVFWQKITLNEVKH